MKLRVDTNQLDQMSLEELEATHAALSGELAEVRQSLIEVRNRIDLLVNRQAVSDATAHLTDAQRKMLGGDR